MKLLSSLLCSLLVAVPSAAFAGKCVQKRLPDGTYMMECPSESPNPPPSNLPFPTQRPYPSPQTAPMPRPIQPPPVYYGTCYTDVGSCQLSWVGAPVPSGMYCTCMDASGYVYGGRT